MIMVTFIVNGSRKLSRFAREVIDRAQNTSQLEITIVTTDRSKHAIELAKLASVKSDIIVAIGGDGTCNEIVQGIVESNDDVTFALLPNGTGNDFARMLPKFEVDEFIKALIENRSTSMDVGCAQFQDHKRYFANIADLGFGARVVEIMNNQRKNKLGGKISYSLAIVRAFFTYKKSVVKIQGDNFEFEGKALMIAFCNGSTFGHGLMINPDAKLNNNTMCITVIGDISLMTYIRKLGDLKKGRKIQHPEAFYFESKSIEIQNLQENVSMEGDGELFGRGLKSISILPGKMKLLSKEIK